MLNLRAEGLSRKQVATRMGVSEHTVKNYIARAYVKLGADGLLQALKIIGAV